MAASLLKFNACITLNLSRRNCQQCQVWIRHKPCAILVFTPNFGSRTKHTIYHQSLINTIRSRNIWTKSISSYRISSCILSNLIRNQPYHILKQSRFLSSSPTQKQGEEEEDDLRAILKNKSLSITEKFKIIFKQYGLVMVAVHLLTSAIWIFIFYQAISRGIDFTPFLERSGIFDHMEKWGISFVDKVRSSGASDYVVTYVVYELAKPIRYLITLFGTMYAVRYLRRKGFIKRPPKSATMSELVQTQSKIVRHRFKKRRQYVKDQYNNRVGKKDKPNGKRRNGHNGEHSREMTPKTDINMKQNVNRRNGHSVSEDASKKKINN